MKQIILGLDAMNIPLVKKLPVEMPILNRLLQEGAAGTLKSVIPPFTGATWVSFQTGKDIGKHGILGFFKYDDNFNIQLTSGVDLKEKPFYAYCDEYGKKCFIMNLPCSEPPRIKGDIIHSWLAAQNKQDGLTHPANLAEKFPSIKNYKNYPNRDKNVKTYLNSTYELELSRIAVIKEVIASKKYDLMFFMIGGTDWIQHKTFLDLMDEKNNSLTKISKKLLAAVDELVGSIISNMDPETNLLIISDHGFREYHGKFFINSWLKNNGYLITAKEGKEMVEHINQTKQKRNLNLSKLVVFLKKHPHLLHMAELFYDKAIKIIPFNVIKQPKVDLKQTLAYCPSTFEQMIYLKKDLPEDQKNKLKAEIIAKINALAGIKALDATTYLKGAYAHKMGDILLVPEDWELDSTIGDQEFLKIRRCWHGMDGIFIGYGSAFKNQEIKDAKLIDIMPTILHLFGIPLPADLDGQALTAVINAEKIEVLKPKKTDSMEKENIKAALQGIHF